MESVESYMCNLIALNLVTWYLGIIITNIGLLFRLSINLDLVNPVEEAVNSLNK